MIFVMSGDTFGCYNLGGRYWHLVGRGQGCCQTTFCRHRMAPTTEDSLTPNINSAEAEKPEYMRMNDKYVSLVGDREPEPYI